MIAHGRRREALWGWFFLAPFAVLFSLTFLVPIGASIWASMFRRVSTGGGLYGGGEVVDRFVGVDNYATALSNEALWRGLGRVLLFGSFQIPIMIGGALVLALLLDTYVLRRVAPVLRLTYFLPYAIPGVIAALVWTYLYTPGMSPFTRGLAWLSGVINDTFGTDLDLTINFFSSNIILASMANMTTWTFMGYNMLIFLAALQAIPHDLYEAARIDGAGEWRIVRSVKIPMLSSAALLAVLLSIIGTVQLFNEPVVLQAVNPWMGNAYTPMMMAYYTMMGGLSPSGDGPASAISVIMAVVAGLLAAIYAFAQRKVQR
ncbi:carbohydrate ABC transporter permease [Ornithinimicrobium sp. Y1847]|uniref:carbohydrate ABC transporter permease n=1 Tax=Ornithinimicrobium sp. Y1847 TaxID=3405419 RepID=UPI003B673578